MPKRLIVLSSDRLNLSFLIKEETVYRICVDEKGSKRLAESIFKGRVKRLARGMDGVFVDIGIGRDAFLPIKNEKYKVGDFLIVQMLREPEGEKGAKLTTNIKLIGKYVIYFPRGKDLKCSSKIQHEEKERICGLLEEEIKEEGVILRSAATKSNIEDIKEELRRLRELWQKIQRKAKALKKPQMILEEYPAYIRLIRDYWHELEEIATDSTDLWHEIASLLEEFEPGLLKKSFYIKDIYPYVQRYKIEDSLMSIFRKVIWLKSGGYITIEETEAFTIIDVNSGDPLGSCHEENALRTNLEAVKEIARQIILRDIGGIILVDFIDMEKIENKELIIKNMRSTFGDEACNINIHGFTKLGILEMSRRKVGKSITKILTEACPYCHGKGYIKASNYFLFELEEYIKNYPYKTIDLQVHPYRYEVLRDFLKSKGYSFIHLKENHQVDINNFNISHG